MSQIVITCKKRVCFCYQICLHEMKTILRYLFVGSSALAFLYPLLKLIEAINILSTYFKLHTMYKNIIFGFLYYHHHSFLLIYVCFIIPPKELWWWQQQSVEQVGIENLQSLTSYLWQKGQELYFNTMT